MEGFTEFLSKFGLPIVVIGSALAILGVIRLVVRNYKKVSPNEVLVVSGRGTKQEDGSRKGYRVVQGGATFVWPVFETAQLMPLGLMQIEVGIQNAPNIDGVPIQVNAIANVKIATKREMLMAAVERFLGKDPEEIPVIIKGVLEGTLRQMIGTLTIEEIVRKRESLAAKIVEITSEELGKIGVVCDNFVISDVTDAKGYIEAMGAKRVAEVKRDAAIAQAEANREATIKTSDASREAEKTKLSNQQQVAEAQRDLDLKRAEFLQQTAKAQAEADLAGEIAKTTTEQKLVTERAKVQAVNAEQLTHVAEKEALRKEKELIATTIKPAEAAREAARINADAARIQLEIQAEAQKKKAVIDANAAAEALTLKTKAESEAAKTRAEAEAQATRARAEAERTRLTAEGEGHAAAEAATKRQLGLAEAEILKARQLADAESKQRLLEAEAAGAKAKGEAEGTAIRARLLAEAEGIDAKNKALATMSDGARLVLILDRMPDVIDHAGVALEKALTPVANAVGSGLAAIDEVKIIDLGGGGGADGGKPGDSALAQYAGIAPSTVLKATQVLTAFGLDVPTLAQRVFGGPKSETPAPTVLTPDGNGSKN